MRRFFGSVNNSVLLDFQNFFTLNKAQSNLDFETRIVEIPSKSRKMYYFQVEHSKFYKSNFVNFCAVNFQILQSIKRIYISYVAHYEDKSTKVT